MSWWQIALIIIGVATPLLWAIAFTISEGISTKHKEEQEKKNKEDKTSEFLDNLKEDKDE